MPLGLSLSWKTGVHLINILLVRDRYTEATHLSLCTYGQFWRKFFSKLAKTFSTVLYAIVVCLSVHLSQVGVLLKWLNVKSCKDNCTIAA